MKLITIGNRIVNLDLLSDAEIIPPDQSETGDLALTLWFGADTWVELFDLEATQIWDLLSSMSVVLTRKETVQDEAA